MNAMNPNKSSMSEDCVSLDALSMPDEQEQMETPEVGDKVQYSVEGEITRIEGNNAYVKKAAVNGQPVEHSEPDADEAGGESDNDADNMRGLETMARGMDASGGY